jgi:hypothetical protein
LRTTCGQTKKNTVRSLTRKEIKAAHRQVATHGTTSLKRFRDRVNLQDATELVPVLDVFLVGPIEIVKVLLYGDVEHVPCRILRWVAFPPLGLLTQTIEFGDRRVRRSILELGVLREKTLQRRFNAQWPDNEIVVVGLHRKWVVKRDDSEARRCHRIAC